MVQALTEPVDLALLVLGEAFPRLAMDHAQDAPHLRVQIPYSILVFRFPIMIIIGNCSDEIAHASIRRDNSEAVKSLCRDEPLNTAHSILCSC